MPPGLGWPTGQGKFRVSEVSWNRTSLAHQLDGDLALQPGVLKIEDVSGDFAQGMARLQAIVNLRQPRLSRFVASFDSVRLDALAAAIPSVAGLASGNIDMTLRGSLARPWRIEGNVNMSGGRALGLDVSDLRLPLKITFDPGSQSADLAIVDGSGQIGHGRAQIRATVRSAGSVAADLEAQFSDINIQPLVAQAGSLGQLAAGYASGTLKLHGQDMQNPQDISGSLQARLRNVQPGGLPVFTQIQPYLSGGFAGAGFTEGTVRVNLGHGVANVEQLAMTGPNLQLYASGKVGLSGSLDLDVYASNYQSPAGIFGPALLARLPLAATGPVGVLIAVNQALSNRVVYLDVTGTVRAPIIQLRPLPILTTEAARFFLGGGF